jgi:signal transduction histidine kinase/CheY-like chemotaxis protein
MDRILDLDQARSLLSGLPHLAVLIDEDRKVLLSNQDLACVADSAKSAKSTPGGQGLDSGDGGRSVEGKCYWELHGVTIPLAECPLNEVLETGVGVERRLLSPVGGRWFRLGIYPTGLRTPLGKRVLLHIQRELSAEASAAGDLGGLPEDALRSQRLESLGRLAGGVAHDFNNLLAVIMNYSRFIAEDLGENDRLYHPAREIEAASERAAELTRQLLLFSRKEEVKPQIIDMKVLLQGLTNLLGRTIGEDIDLDMQTEERLWSVLADPNQLEQVLVNLSINARDAMPRGGRLIVRISNAVLDNEFAARHADIEAGLYVLITVKDTGEGMATQVLEHIFEPFYTTKPEGKGTGLGLAMAYGVVGQAGGHILVDSQVDVGTRFRIFLPAVDQRPSGVFAQYQKTPKAGQGETVLVVEDDQHVRAMCARFLKRAGYKALQAASGDDVLFIMDAFEGEVDLLITDVVLPGMSGREVARRLQERFGRMAVLYMSGHSREAVLEYGVLSADARFIEKPFTVDDLLRRVRAALEDGEVEPGPESGPG